MTSPALPDNFLPLAQITRNATVTPVRDPFVQNFGHKFVNFGSCFAQNLKRILDNFGLETFFLSEICAHYNTETLVNVLEIAADGRAPNRDDFISLDGKMWAYRQHFKYPFQSEEVVGPALGRIAGMYDVLRKAVREADTFIITLGTSRVIRLRSNGAALAVGAGLPREHWQLDMLDVDQNVAHLCRIATAISSIRGGKPANVVLTVSPQRYLFGHLFKEGQQRHEGVALVDNFLSKCYLRVAAQQVTENPPSGLNYRYFPALEIVLDELRPFESIAHYDYCHINQQHTPDLVVKKFLLAYASEEILEQLSAATRVEARWAEIAKLRRGGLPADAPEIVRALDAVEEELDRFGDALSAPLLNIRYHLLTEYKRPLKRLFYPFESPGNLNSAARILAAVGRVSEAREVLQRVMAHVGPRRTEDPEAGLSVEHTAFNEAYALWNNMRAATA